MSTGEVIWVITLCVIGALGVVVTIQCSVEQNNYTTICTELGGVAIHADGKSYCIKREAFLHVDQK